MSETRTDQSPFTAVLLEKGGRFYFYEPGLSVVASSETVEGAYEKFVHARREFIEEVDRAGLTASRLSAPSQAAAQLSVRHNVGAELRLFLAKACIVLVLIAAIGMVAVSGVKRSIDGLALQFKGLQTLSMVDIADKAAVIVQDVQAMPEERRELLRQSIGTLSREIEPIVEAWRNPPPKAPPGTPNKTGR